jgi:hypothetical protein
MRKIAGIIITLLMLPLLTGCALIIGAGSIETKDYSETDFDSVSVSEAFESHITQGNSYSVKVTTNNNIFDYVDVYKSGSRLYVEIKNGYSVNTDTLKVEITCPELNGLDINGASSAYVSNFSITDFNICVSGASYIKCYSSTINNLNATVSGASKIDLSSSTASKVYVNVSGASSAYLNMDGSGSLSGAVSGASVIEYSGTPTSESINILDITSKVVH